MENVKSLVTTVFVALYFDSLQINRYSKHAAIFKYPTLAPDWLIVVVPESRVPTTFSREIFPRRKFQKHPKFLKKSILGDNFFSCLIGNISDVIILVQTRYRSRLRVVGVVPNFSQIERTGAKRVEITFSREHISTRFARAHS